MVLGDWAALRQQVGDGWQRELFEGADFDAQAAKVLQSPAELAKAGTVPGNWFATQTANRTADGLPGWRLFYQGAGWVLYQSAVALPAEGPKPAEQKGLPGCKHQSGK
jgi:hypothetical protein